MKVLVTLEIDLDCENIHDAKVSVQDSLNEVFSNKYDNLDVEDID